jgi:hypothetical protein
MGVRGGRGMERHPQVSSSDSAREAVERTYTVTELVDLRLSYLKYRTPLDGEFGNESSFGEKRIIAGYKRIRTELKRRVGVANMRQNLVHVQAIMTEGKE